MLKHARLLESRSGSSKPPQVNLNRLLEVEVSRLPYSRSHAKRLKRKAKEELAGGPLSDIQSAIAAMESNEESLGGKTLAEPPKNEPSKPPTKKQNPGLIGEGKAAPLSQNQRKNALYVSPPPNPRIGLIPH
jgi:ribosome biogenesis protein SLX9